MLQRYTSTSTFRVSALILTGSCERLCLRLRGWRIAGLIASSSRHNNWRPQNLLPSSPVSLFTQIISLANSHHSSLYLSLPIPGDTISPWEYIMGAKRLFPPVLLDGTHFFSNFKNSYQTFCWGRREGRGVGSICFTVLLWRQRKEKCELSLGAYLVCKCRQGNFFCPVSLNLYLKCPLQWRFCTNMEMQNEHRHEKDNSSGWRPQQTLVQRRNFIDSSHTFVEIHISKQFSLCQGNPSTWQVWHIGMPINPLDYCTDVPNPGSWW